jgi:hypothetical protein
LEEMIEDVRLFPYVKMDESELMCTNRPTGAAP